MKTEKSCLCLALHRSCFKTEGQIKVVLKAFLKISLHFWWEIEKFPQQL